MTTRTTTTMTAVESAEDKGKNNYIDDSMDAFSALPVVLPIALERVRARDPARKKPKNTSKKQ